MPDSTKSQQPKLLDQVRQVLRLHHYSIHTERSYVDWIVRFVRFYSMRSREDLFPAEAKIESFLTDLAVHANVAPATQNQAMNVLVFLYPGSRRPRAMPVHECAKVWPGCRPTLAWSRVPRAMPVGLHKRVLNHPLHDSINAVR